MVGGSTKDALDVSKAVNVYQYVEVMKSFLGELQPNQPKRSVLAHRKTIPSGLFCMSGPVAHVDDDEEDEEEDEENNNNDNNDNSDSFNNGLDLIHAHTCEAYHFEKKIISNPCQNKKKKKKKNKIKKNKKKKHSLSCENLFLGLNEKNRGEAEHISKWSDNGVCEGEFGFDEQISGWGKASWPSGTFYEGEIMAGNLHGVGTLKSPDGSVYKGNWILNKKHGFGRKMYANGDVYEGSWKWDLPEGQGRYSWSNGNEYYGKWKNGMMSGRGMLMWSCGDKYDGHWVDGLADGHGVYTWADGSSYFGNWKKGSKFGKGRFIPSDNQFLQEKQCLQGHTELSDKDHVYGEGCFVIDEEMESSNVVGSYNRPKVCSPSHMPRELRKITQSFPSDTFRQLMVNAEGNNFIDRLCRCGSLKEESLSRCFDASHGELKKQVGVLEESRGNQQKKLPGEVIDKGHRSYDFMLNLQLGIRYSVGNVTPKPRRKLVPTDFGLKARIRMNFPREGSQLTPSHSSSDFKWKDYCPLVFRHLRETFSIDAAEYMLSICGNDGLRELSSPGKSGSIFYLSHNERFVIKTLRKVEVKALLKMLPRYYDHVQTNKNTLLTRFFGLHRIKPATGPKVRFMVMGNVVSSESRIHRKFDLKGSSQGRSTERESDTDYGTTLKDLDLDLVFQLDTSWKHIVLEQISKDCKFLESEHIMDYSLLLGVHFSKSISSKSEFKNGPQESKSLKEQAHLISTATQTYTKDKPPTWEKDRCAIQIGSNMPAIASRKLKDGNVEVFEVRLYFGIIDILQEYDMGKRLEHAYKSIQFDSLSISAVDPELYSKRFQLFISEIFREKT